MKLEGAVLSMYGVTGLAGGDWVARDPDWERLRHHPRFQALAKRLAQR